MLSSKSQIKMKTLKLIICLPILFIGLFSKAQISLHQSDMPAIGSKFAYVVSEYDSNFNPGPGGPNQVWNIVFNSNKHEIDSTYIISPASTIYSTVFPTSNICFENNVGSLHYFELNNDSLVDIGGGSYNGSDTFIRRNRIFNFPVNYLSQIVNHNLDTVKYLNPWNFNDSLMHIVDQNITLLIDGWGTVTTPCGTYNCLRRKTSTVGTTADYTKIGTTWNLDSINNYSVNFFYEWFSDSGKFLIASVYSDDSLTAAGLKYQLSCTPLSINNSIKVNSFQISPNPATTSFTIISESTIKHITIRDLYGKIVLQKECNWQQEKINTSMLSKGIYLVTATDAKDKSLGKQKLIID